VFAVVLNPVEAIARLLPESTAAGYRERSSEVAGTIGIGPNRRYRYLAVACCLAIALLVGVGVR